MKQTRAADWHGPEGPSDWDGILEQEPNLLSSNGQETAPTGQPVTSNSRIGWGNLADVAMKSIRFADKPFFQHSAFHLMVGVKNAGKGTTISHLAARVNRGELGPKRRVMWIAIGEDSYAIDIKPRTIAAGGNPSLVEIVTKGQLLLPHDINEIERKAGEHGDVGLVVLDPLGGGLAAGKNTNHDNDVRPAISPLNQLADTLDCMIVGVRHVTNKELKNGVLAGILGASDWANIPRCVIAIAKDDQDEDIRHMQVIAGNRSRLSDGRMFRIEGRLLPGLEEEVTCAVMLGDSSKDVETLLATRPTRDSKSTKARDLILDILETEGEQESDALDARVARETGLAVKTIKNTRTTLGKEGLLKAAPDKDEYGEIKRWLVVRSGAPRP